MTAPSVPVALGAIAPAPRTQPRLGRGTAIALIGLTLLGLGVRWWNISVVRPVCDPPRADPDGDCFELYGSLSDPLYGHLQGRLIAQGHWFVNPFIALREPADVDPSVRFQEVRPSGPYVRSVGDPPLYQLFLGALTKLGFQSGQAQRLWSAVVGTAVIPLVGLLGLRLRSRRAALIAAAIAAVHPLLWINDGMLLSEAVYAPLVAASLLAAYALRARPDRRHAAALGFLVTLAAFARGEAITLLGLLVVPVVLTLPGVVRKERLVLLGMAAAASATLVVPWNAWLNMQFDRPVLMTAASGSVLSASSCDRHFYGPDVALFIYCTVDVDLPPGIDESERDALVREASIRYIRSNLRRLPVVVAARIGRMWDLYGPRQNVDMNIAVEDRGRLPSQAGLLTYYALLPLAAAGVVSLRRRRIPWWPFASIAVMVTLTAAMTFGLTRYRVPADVALVVLGAIGLDALLSRARRPRPTPVA